MQCFNFSFGINTWYTLTVTSHMIQNKRWWQRPSVPWWWMLDWPLLTSIGRKKARSDFLSGRGICTRIGRRLADAEEIFRDVGTARWHFVAPATTFQPFYPDLRFLGSLGSGGSGSRNRYYPSPPSTDRNFAQRPSTFDSTWVYTNSEITQLISTLSGTHSSHPWSKGLRGSPLE